MNLFFYKKKLNKDFIFPNFYFYLYIKILKFLKCLRKSEIFGKLTTLGKFQFTMFKLKAF